MNYYFNIVYNILYIQYEKFYIQFGQFSRGLLITGG